METGILEIEYGDSMDIYSERVMFFEAPTNNRDVFGHLLEEAADELCGDGYMMESVFKNVKYLYSIYDVLKVGEEDYAKALSVMHSGKDRYTYYLNIESMDEKGLKMITMINGNILPSDNVLLLEKDLEGIRDGLIKKEEYGFYYDLEKELFKYISMKKDGSKGTLELSSFTPGEIFTDCDGVEYVVCEHFKDGTVSVITKYPLDVGLEFGQNNNWKESKRRIYLNGEYLEKLGHKFGEDSIVIHEADLLSLDGHDDYGVSRDKVSDMTLDRFRRYSKNIGNCCRSYGLATPNRTSASGNELSILFVDENSAIGSINCREKSGIRPFFVMKSSVLVIPV